MITTVQLSPGVVLRHCPDPRFKKCALSFQLLRPMCEEEAALNALLPSVLLRGTENYPDLRSITWRLDELYGASVHTMVRRVGDLQTVGFYLSVMEDRFALEPEGVLSFAADFLRELMLCPLTEGDAFGPEIVDSEKKNLISAIESELNDKRAYISSRMIRRMCAGDSFAVPRLGRAEDVAAITPETLYAHYQRILRESPVEFFYVGANSVERVARLLKPMAEALGGNAQTMPRQTAFTPVADPSEFFEEMDVNQGKLSMGFTTSVTNRHPDFAAMQVLSTLFGSGMTSKLFQNIREKQSLCYDIGSSYYGSKGILTVNAGIDFDKEGLVRAEIEKELAGCREGRITPEELAAAKASICSSLTGTHDSPGAIEGYYASGALSGNRLDPEAYIAAVQAVTADDCARVASTLRYHTGFFLKGGA